MPPVFQVAVHHVVYVDASLQMVKSWAQHVRQPQRSTQRCYAVAEPPADSIIERELHDEATTSYLSVRPYAAYMCRICARRTLHTIADSATTVGCNHIVCAALTVLACYERVHATQCTSSAICTRSATQQQM